MVSGCSIGYSKLMVDSIFDSILWHEQPHISQALGLDITFVPLYYS
jgi:hypothetical protein